MGVPELMALGFDDLLACKMTAQDVGPLMLAMKEILEGAQTLDQKQVGGLGRSSAVGRSCTCETRSILVVVELDGDAPHTLIPGLAPDQQAHSAPRPSI